MKMGEIRVRPDGGFAMMTPDGVRDVTLRCTVAGSVEVEEVSTGGLSIQALMIAISNPPSPIAYSEVARAAVRQARE